MNNDMKYVGACALLGRLSSAKMSQEDLFCIECALNDCVKSFPGRFEVVKTSSGGFSLEPILEQAINES